MRLLIVILLPFQLVGIAALTVRGVSAFDNHIGLGIGYFVTAWLLALSFVAFMLSLVEKMIASKTDPKRDANTAP